MYNPLYSIWFFHSLRLSLFFSLSLSPQMSRASFLRLTASVLSPAPLKDNISYMSSVSYYTILDYNIWYRYIICRCHRYVCVQCYDRVCLINGSKFDRFDEDRNVFTYIVLAKRKNQYIYYMNTDVVMCTTLHKQRIYNSYIPCNVLNSNKIF